MPRRDTCETRFLAERMQSERLGMRDALARMHEVALSAAEGRPLGARFAVGAIALGGAAVLCGRFGVLRPVGRGAWHVGRLLIVGLVSNWIRDDARAARPETTEAPPQRRVEARGHERALRDGPSGTAM